MIDNPRKKPAMAPVDEERDKRPAKKEPTNIPPKAAMSIKLNRMMRVWLYLLSGIWIITSSPGPALIGFRTWIRPFSCSLLEQIGRAAHF